jgi:hypothetical protein
MNTKPKKKSLGPWLRKLGFDESYFRRDTWVWKVKCSQCEAVVINGTPCHEPGCPNRKKEEE